MQLKKRRNHERGVDSARIPVCGTHLIQLNRQGKPSYRCYTLEFRKELLRRLLRVQEQVRREGPDPSLTLIDFEELCAIRELWRSEGDWEDSLPQIYREIVGHDEAWPVHENERWMNARTKEAILYHCQRRDSRHDLSLSYWRSGKTSIARWICRSPTKQKGSKHRR